MFALGACGDSKSGSGSVLKVIDIPLTEEEYAYAVSKGDAELLASVNAFLADIKANGKFDEVINKYFGDGTPEGVTSAAPDSSKDQLVVATNAGFAPFEYKEGDTYYGVDMEIMGLLAESLNKELVINNMEFESVCTAVAEGMCDIAAAGLTITEKRKEILDFTDAYYNASQVLIAKGDDTTFDSCKTAADVEAILNGLELPEVPANPELRARLQGRSLAELTDMLAQMKVLHNTTDVDTAKRAIRAIEIASFYQEHPDAARLATPHPLTDAVTFCLDIPRDIRRQRISDRLRSRLNDGMVDEVRRLIDSGINPDDLIYYGLEYKYLTEYVIGRYSFDEMFRQLEIAIHQFAKRQMTWFRKFEPAVWFDLSQGSVADHEKRLLETARRHLSEAKS